MKMSTTGRISYIRLAYFAINGDILSIFAVLAIVGVLCLDWKCLDFSFSICPELFLIRSTLLRLRSSQLLAVGCTLLIAPVYLSLVSGHCQTRARKITDR